MPKSMKATYETHNDIANTISLTLLRCLPLCICVIRETTDYSKTDKGSQSPGKQSFRYAIMPNRGDWQEAHIW
jgi:hypothetical protein